MEAVIFVGIQAAGKSTFYRERFFTSHVRISLDLLRTRHRERSLLAWCLQHGQRFVVDNTNVTAAGRAGYIAPARAAGFRAIGYVFESNVPASITRNAGRPQAEQVPAKAIGGTKKRMEWPRRDEGFDELHFIRIALAAASSSRSGVMQFEALDRAMRVYETAHDHQVLPGLWMVARLGS